jgi:hypothetical protein
MGRPMFLFIVARTDQYITAAPQGRRVQITARRERSWCREASIPHPFGDLPTPSLSRLAVPEPDTHLTRRPLSKGRLAAAFHPPAQVPSLSFHPFSASHSANSLPPVDDLRSSVPPTCLSGRRRFREPNQGGVKRSFSTRACLHRFWELLSTPRAVSQRPDILPILFPMFVGGFCFLHRPSVRRSVYC